MIVEQLLYLNAETLGTGVNVDVNLKRPLKGGGGGTALNSCAGGQHIAAQVRGQRQQGQTLSTSYNDTHDSGNIAILSFNGHFISAIFLDLSSPPTLTTGPSIDSPIGRASVHPSRRATARFLQVSSYPGLIQEPQQVVTGNVSHCRKEHV